MSRPAGVGEAGGERRRLSEVAPEADDAQPRDPIACSRARIAKLSSVLPSSTRMIS